MNTTTKQNQNKNKKQNRKECNGGGECCAKVKVGDQAFLPATSRATGSFGKAQTQKGRGGVSRATPYGPVMVKNPHIRLKKIDVMDYKVDHSGSTFKITMRGNGEFLRKEEMDPQPDPSGLGSPRPPAENPGKASSAPSCAPTKIIDPASLQEEEVFDQDSLDGKDTGDIDVGDDDDAMLVLLAKEKKERGRPPTTGEHVGKREKEEEKARKRKEEEKERLAAESLKPMP